MKKNAVIAEVLATEIMDENYRGTKRIIKHRNWREQHDDKSSRKNPRKGNAKTPGKA